MAATAGRSRLLVLSRSVAGLTAGFPGLVVSRQRPHRTVHQRLPAWLSQQVAFCSTASPSDDVTVVYQNGFPVITVNLPSRQEKCRFTLKPISDSVGVFLNQLQNEDRGIDRVAIYSTDGSRVASSTGIDVLLLDDFKLSINDKIYDVRTPKRELLSHEHATTMDDVKHLVQQLHTSMHIKDFQVNREKELCSRLEQLQGQLEPHEKARLQTAQKAAKMTRIVQWGGLAYMSVQFGILARLTWWEYSWDIMEPVTYFITYSGIIGMYCYFLLTGKEYIYPEATDRQYLNFFHKTSRKTGFNYLEYNRLKDDIAQVELDLKRLRDPLQMHLPLQQIDDKDQSLQNS
ncbi:hypothetical protein GDO81_004374 [Engystomops pustulosus]|uniref:Calcium uniporter protein n=1 Tax=Engystomops pustulosus TaxID=76066 RepID=A0AAV6ZVG3_ENGPU|nr:hypothetical protein GDO81_004374 [Engystomops pustulosus]